MCQVYTAHHLIQSADFQILVIDCTYINLSKVCGTHDKPTDDVQRLGVKGSTHASHSVSIATWFTTIIPVTITKCPC